MSRDPGLQPERTSISWLRTQLVFSIIGFLIFKLAASIGHVTFSVVGLIAIAIAAASTLYTKHRFNQTFSDAMAVTAREYRVKLLLSSLVFGLALICLALLWIG